MTLDELIKETEQNRDQYRHSWSLYTLWSYLLGFVCCRSADQPIGCENPLNTFSLWVGKQFGLELTFSACRILILKAPNPSVAVDLFYALWDRYSRETSVEPLPPIDPDTWSPLSKSELINQIQTRPGHYIGDASFQEFLAYMDGYEHAAQTMGFSIEDTTFQKFTEWVAQKGITGIDHPWYRIMECFSGDKLKLLRECFTLWDDYHRIDDLIEQHRQDLLNRETLVEAAEACCELGRVEGAALITYMLDQFSHKPEDQREWLTKQALLLEFWRSPVEATQAFEAALSAHQQIPETEDHLWDVRKRMIESALERLNP